MQKREEKFKRNKKMLEIGLKNKRSLKEIKKD